MKNVTNSLKPSESTEIEAPKPVDFFEKDDFTISINDFYTGQWSRHKATGYLEALDALKKEARSRGYNIREWMSNDTMINYVHFSKPRL